MSFLKRLGEGPPLLLDGATGTELHRRGVDTALPLWSARALLEAPEVLRRIHADYAAAGAEVLTADTFRTHARNLAAAGLADQAAALTRRAVEIAREAAGGMAWVAGSQAPLEDCYEPARVPGDDALAREHALMAGHLQDAGVDLILVETQNSVREAVAAGRAAAGTGLPVVISFVCGTDGRLLSGEDLTEAVRAVLPLKPAGIGVNCCPTPSITGLLEVLKKAAPGLPLAAYGNVGHADPVQGWVSDAVEDPEAYARHAGAWLQAGARLVGGCCGTTPAHIRKLRALSGA